ncbi:MAG: PAS domain S-box protein [Flavobacteriales bacterium]
MTEKGTFHDLPDHLDRVQSPIFLIDGEKGRIDDLNGSAEEIFGSNKDGWKGCFFDDLFRSDQNWRTLKGVVLEYGCYRAGPVQMLPQKEKVFLNIHPLYIGKDGLMFAAHLDRLADEPSYDNGKEELHDPQLLEYLDEIIFRYHISEKGEKEPIYINPRIEEIFGIDASEYAERVRSGQLEEFIHSEDIEPIRTVLGSLRKDKKAISVTYRVFPEGQKEAIWVENKIYPFFDQQKELVEVMETLRNITEQKVVERRLLQRERYFRNLFENNLAGVFRTTLDRELLSCNQAFVQMIGFDRKEGLIGKKVEELYEDSTDKGSFVDLVLGNEGLTGHESKVLLKDGRTKYFIENATPIRDDEGNAIYIDGTVIDITELKETNIALKESEERYRTLIDAAVDAIFVWEWESGRIVNVNKSASQILDRKEEDILGRELKDFLPDDKVGSLAELMKRSHDEREFSLIDEDSALIDPKGHQIPVEVNARTFELRGVPYVIGLFRDISKWVESRQALQDSEERFRLLAESTFEGIVMSKDRKVVDMNDQFIRIFGYSSRDELLGKDLVGLIHPDYKELGRKRMVGEGNDDMVEAKGIKKDNSVIDVVVQGQFIPYHGEEVRVTVVTDITARKRIEEELQERERSMSTLLGNLPGIAYRCYNDPDWTMEFISQGCKELLGFHPDQLIRNREYSYGKLILEEDQDQVWNAVQEAVSNGSRFDIQYRIRTLEGSVRTVWERGEAVGKDEESGITMLEGFIIDISKRVEYERELEVSRSRYRDLFENSPYGAILFKKGQIIYLNDRARNFMGLRSAEEAPSQNILDYVDPEFHPTIKERMERVMNGEDLPFIDIRGELPFGRGKIELETKLDLVEYQGEEVFYIAFRDIAKEKQLEKQQMRAQVAEEYNKQLEKEIEEHERTHQKLRDSQEFTRSIIDSSLDMIIASDKEGRITVFNDAAETEFGYSREEIIGQEAELLFLDRSDREHVLKNMKDEGGFTGEIWNVDKEGGSFLTYLSATALKDHGGEVIGSMGISRDITELKEAEEELRKSEEKYRAIYDQAYIGIAQVDLKGNFLNANQQLCAITGYSEEELRSMNFQDITPPEYQERSDNFRKILEQKKEERVSFEKQYIHKKGFRIDVNLTVALVKDRNDDPAYFVTVFEDITERKKNEQELIRSLKEKEVLLREVHHRVKNNLQVISSILNLQSNFVNDSNTLQILRESQNRISSMSFIHESLYRKDEFDSIDLAQYVKELSTNLLHSFHQKEKNIQLEHEMEEVNLDLDQAIPCGLIINELVSNALKYAFEDQNDGKLRIEVRQENKNGGGSEVAIRIADNGTGLPEGYKVGESDSLGLQLVSSLLEQLKGNIRLKQDNGTDYLITFDKQ